MKYHHIYPYFSCLFLIFFITACTSTPQEVEDPNKYIFPELKEVSSIRDYDIDSWSEVDKKSLIVNTSPSKSYLIILRKANHDLKFAHAISFGKEGRIFSKFDRIHIINTTQDIEPLPAYIERIYKLESKEQKKQIRAKIREKKSKTLSPEE